MKKIYFIILAASAFLATGCMQEHSFPEILKTDGKSDLAIGFDVYTASSVTKGTAIAANSLYGTTENDGVGIFAFSQNSVDEAPQMFNSNKFTEPTFMNNQQMTKANSSVSSWTYSPLRYWPNDDNARISFFAYAPYSSDTEWSDLKITTDSLAAKLNIGFTIASSAEEQKDYLWCTPAINQGRSTKGIGTEEVNINRVIGFDFKHATSRVAIQIGMSDGTDGKEAVAWTDPNTEIEIKSIIFKGISKEFSYAYTITDGMLQSDAVIEYGDTFNLTVRPRAEVAVIKDEIWKTGDGGVLDEKGYASYLTPNTATGLESSNAQYLFLAPQTFSDEVITVTYEVVTRMSPGVDGEQDSRMTNVISKKLSDVFPEVSDGKNGLAAGKAYVLKFLIGLDDVSLDASMMPWTTSTSQVVHVNQDSVYSYDASDIAVKVSAHKYSGLTVDYVNCSGSGKGVAGEKLTFAVSGDDEYNMVKIVGGKEYLMVKGTDYTVEGNEITYTIPSQIPSEIKVFNKNIIPFKYSVGENKSVYFTKGNLYADIDSQPVTWGIEEYQYSYQATYQSSHVSHFFWSSNVDVATSATYSDSKASVNDVFFADISTPLAVDGMSGLYVLTRSEMSYLLYNRTNAAAKRKCDVSVNGSYYCVILAPDSYTGSLSTSTSYTDTQWNDAESLGFVCFISAGYREGNTIKRAKSNAKYWESTADSSDNSKAYRYMSEASTLESSNLELRKMGMSVRLVAPADD